MHIALTHACNEQLSNAVEVTSEREICGLLFGEKKDIVVIKEFVQLENCMRGEHSFAMKKRDMVYAISHNPQDFIGVFHTHLHSNELTEYDINGITETENIWLVGSKYSEQLFKAYKYDKSTASIVNLELLHGKKI